jgi:ceramide glucosyltransferase
LPLPTLLSLVLFGAAVFGLLALTVQWVCVHIHLRRRSPEPKYLPGISLLKPLCGVDDDLEENLASFAALDYAGAWEVVLGVKDTSDAAWPVAQKVVARWPRRFRLVLQEGTPGLNPKVNQLITLARHARHEVLVVSDSNVRVQPDYLREIAAHLTQDNVGCVTHAVVGQGEETLGSLMDNTHLATTVGAGQIASMVAAGKPLVVGKSMALWRADLDSLGGFAAMKDYLAEDFVFGVWVTQRLKKRVAVGRGTVHNYSRHKGVADFFSRYRRWGVIHRTSVSLHTSVGQGLLQPGFWAVLGTAMQPTRQTALALLAVLAGKLVLDLLQLKALRPSEVTLRLLYGLLLKDVLIQFCWLNGFFERTVDWRGRRLRVGYESRLLGEEPQLEPSLEQEQSVTPSVET